MSPMDGLSAELLEPNSEEVGQSALGHLSSLGLYLTSIDLAHFHATSSGHDTREQLEDDKTRPLLGQGPAQVYHADVKGA
jgi:hypothetical protein